MCAFALQLLQELPAGYEKLGIIGLLMAVTLPVLSRSRRQARMTAELAGSRQLMQAYLMYAAENDGQLIPGHTSHAPALEDDLGRRLMHPEAAKRWPWRLLAETDCGLFGTILVNGQASELTARRLDDLLDALH